MLIEEGFGCEDHSRRAEPALDRPFFCEGLLKRMELSIPGETFDRQDFLFLSIDGKGETRKVGFPVDENGAGPTGSEVAGTFGPCQAQILSQDLKKRLVGFRQDLVVLTIDVKLKDALHRQCLPK
jgi:hypothetical protein